MLTVTFMLKWLRIYPMIGPKMASIFGIDKLNVNTDSRRPGVPSATLLHGANGESCHEAVDKQVIHSCDRHARN
jgi:hypothetical protein